MPLSGNAIGGKLIYYDINALGTTCFKTLLILVSHLASITHQACMLETSVA